MLTVAPACYVLVNMGMVMALGATVQSAQANLALALLDVAFEEPP